MRSRRPTAPTSSTTKTPARDWRVARPRQTAARSDRKRRKVLNGKTGITAALACLAVLTAGGCSQSNGGTPSPTGGTTASGTASSGARSSGANAMPAIPKVLDVSKFAANPCLSITTQQASNLTISSQGTLSPAANGAGCVWKYGPNLEYSVATTYGVPDAKNGLQNLYNLNATGYFKSGYFEPTTIDGYPAVYSDPLGDTRPKGGCQVNLGVNETYLVTLILDGAPGKDGCSSVGKVATDVVETI